MFLISNKCRWSLQIALALLLLCPLTSVSAPVQTLEIVNFSGTLDSVDLFLNGLGTVATGPISLAQDNSKPSSIVLDYNTMTMTNTFSVIFTMPLFSTLGVAPDTLDFSETGTFTTSGGMVSGLLAGSGGPSDMFAVGVGDIDNTWNINSSSTAGNWNVPVGQFVLTFPASNDFDPAGPQVLTTQGSGTFQIVPEPSSFLLTGGAAFLLVVTVLRRRH